MILNIKLTKLISFFLHAKLYKFISLKAKYNTIGNLVTSKSVSVTPFQYLVCPLFSMTAWIRRGMLDTRDSQYSFEISVTQTSLKDIVIYLLISISIYLFIRERDVPPW